MAIKQHSRHEITLPDDPHKNAEADMVMEDPAASHTAIESGRRERRTTFVRSFREAGLNFAGGALSALLSKIRGMRGGAQDSPEETLEDGATSGTWEARLQNCVRDICLATKSMEDEFLSIGSKLQDFHGETKEVAGLSSSVAGLMSGDEINATVEGLRGIFERMQELETESRRGTETLEHILKILGSITSSIAGFKSITRTLNVLCVFTRIENARFSQNDTGFDTLAADIKKLSVDIETKFTDIVAKSNELSQLILQILSRVRDLENRQQGQKRTMLDQIIASHRPLAERMRLASVHAGQISERYDAIVRSIGEMVVSMQFHDITRQRFEHASKGLDGLIPVAARLTGRVPGGAGGNLLPPPDAISGDRAPDHKTLRKGEEEAICEVGDMCELQSVQLRNSSDQLTAAVGTIIDNLWATARNIEAISKEALDISAADGTGQSFLSEVEAGLSFITATLNEYTEANRELSVAMRSVAATLLDMSGFVNEIERIGMQIKMIALNAIVKAAHIGEEGAALSVLAEAVHHLSGSTCEKTAKVAETFKEIVRAAEGLSNVIAGDGEGKDEKTLSMGDELRRLVGALGGINENVAALLARLQDSGRALSEDIEDTIKGVTVHVGVARIVGRVTAGLEDIAACSRLMTPNRSHIDRSETVKALEASYTMNSEREVHQSIIGGAVSGEPDVELFSEVELFSAEDGPAADPGPQAAKEGESSEDDDLGDNVELF